MTTPGDQVLRAVATAASRSRPKDVSGPRRCAKISTPDSPRTKGSTTAPEEHSRFRACNPGDGRKRERNRVRRGRGSNRWSPRVHAAAWKRSRRGCSSVCSSAPVRQRPPSSCLLPKRRVPAVVRFKQEPTTTGSSSPTSRAARAGATCTERPLRARTATVPAHPGVCVRYTVSDLDKARFPSGAISAAVRSRHARMLLQRLTDARIQGDRSSVVRLKYGH